MKKALVWIILLFALASIGFGQNIERMNEKQLVKTIAKASWVEVVKHAESGEVFSLDKSKTSTIRDGDVISFIVKGSKRGTIVYRHYLGNCIHDTLIYVAIYSFTPDGIKYYKNSSLTVDTVESDTVGYTWLDYACTLTS